VPLNRGVRYTVLSSICHSELGGFVALRIFCTTIDCADPAALGAFWGEVLGWKKVFEDDDEVVIEPDDGSARPLLFIKVPDVKQVKNRIHLDLDPDDQSAEVARLEGLGASRVDIGQQDVTWIVMADPEGNEFCVLTPRKDKQ
jgi:predicted enzyme related to lactoylglutathione lyase